MPHRETNIPLIPVTMVIGSAVSQRACHRGAGSVQVRRCSIYESGNPAHDGALFPLVDVLIAARAEQPEPHAGGCECVHLLKAEASHEARGLRG